MIDKLTYDEILKYAEELKKQVKVIEVLIENKNIPQLEDFTATVEGYSKFLENTIEINKDADKALAGLKATLK